MTGGTVEVSARETHAFARHNWIKIVVNIVIGMRIIELGVIVL